MLLAPIVSKMKRAHLNSPDSRGSVVEDDGMSQTSKKMVRCTFFLFLMIFFICGFSLQRMPPQTAGIVHKVSLENFLCHDKLEVEFNNQINFIIGRPVISVLCHVVLITIAFYLLFSILCICIVLL